MAKNIKSKFVVLICLFISILFVSGCAKINNNSFKSEAFIMSTVVTQTVYGKNSEKAAETVNARLKELEKLISLYENNSDIDKVNKNAGLEPVKVDDYTFNLLKKSVEYSKQSNGLFDITVAPLSILWGIDTKTPHIPTKSEIDKVLPLVDYEKLKLDDNDKTAFLQEKGMKIDLGGIAKGYFINEIFSIYENQNIKGAICSVGGNIFTYKQKPDNKDFVLGIRNPLSENPNEIVGKLSSSNQSVATTGTYERYFEKDGIRYHHIFDLKTGYPANSNLLSVTVVCKDGGLSDFLSTTLFLAGESGEDNIKKYLNDEHFSVIFIDNDKNVFCSDDLKDKFVLTNSDFKLK